MTKSRSWGMTITLVMTLCLGGAPGMRGQTRSAPVEGPEHFRWSEAKAHELDRGHTIKSAAGLNPWQKKELTDAVVKQLKQHRSLDEFFAGMPEPELRDLASNTRVELVDLNGDGRPEVVAQASGLGPCGGTGNCIFWIFQLTSTRVRPLLDSFDSEAGFEVLTIRPWTTNGFNDIVLGSHLGASDRDAVWYKYSQGSYRRWACYSLSWAGEDRDLSKSPAIAKKECSELFTPQK